VTEQAVLSGMGIDAADANARIGDAEFVAQSASLDLAPSEL